MSRWASCAVLQTPYDGDIRLIIRPSEYNIVIIIRNYVVGMILWLR